MIGIQEIPNIIIPSVEEEFDRVLSPFKEYLRFNIQSPRDASLFLIGERHDCPEVRQMITDLVNYLTSQGPVKLLVEGVESGKVIDEADKHLYFPCKHPRNLQIIGCDLSEEEFYNKVGMPRSSIEKIERAIEKFQSQISGYKEQIDQLAPGFFTPNGFNIKIFSKLKRSVKLEIEKLLKWMKIDTETKEDMLALLAKCRTYPQATDESSRSAFPARTDAMVKTIQEVDGITVVVFGRDHVLPLDDPHPDYRLTKLIDEMKRHRSVSLVPHKIWPTQRVGGVA